MSKASVSAAIKAVREHLAKHTENHAAAMAEEEPGSSRHTFHKNAIAHNQETDGKLGDCEKAFASEDLEKRGSELQPTEVSGVVPTNENFRRGVTAVPRSGQPQIAKANTVPQFARAFSIDEDLDGTAS